MTIVASNREMRTTFALCLVGLASAALLRAAEPPHPDLTGSWMVESVSTAGGDRGNPDGRRGAFGGGGGGGGGFGRMGRGGGGRRGDGGLEGRARGLVPDEPRLERGQRVEMTVTDSELTVVIAPDAGGRVV